MARFLVTLATAAVIIHVTMPWAASTVQIGLAAVFAIGFTFFDRKSAQKLSQSQNRARLLNDCHEQHDAWKRGDDRMATFGPYYSPEVFD
jgi:hypothetical protein